MVFTQLLYGCVVATNLLGTSPSLFDTNAWPNRITPETSMRVFEAVNERAAAIGWSVPNTVSTTGNTYNVSRPFTYTNAPQWAGYINTYRMTNYPLYAYALSNGTWRIWSFNSFYNTLEGYPTEYPMFLPVVSSSLSVYPWVEACKTIDLITKYYVRSYTPTSVVFWTTGTLWEAAGSTNGNPLRRTTTDKDTAQYRHLGTSAAWIIYRALTNLNKTSVYDNRVWTNNRPYNVPVAGYQYKASGEASSIWNHAECGLNVTSTLDCSISSTQYFDSILYTNISFDTNMSFTATFTHQGPATNLVVLGTKVIEDTTNNIYEVLYLRKPVVIWDFLYP